MHGLRLLLINYRFIQKWIKYDLYKYELYLYCLYHDNPLIMKLTNQGPRNCFSTIALRSIFMQGRHCNIRETPSYQIN